MTTFTIILITWFLAGILGNVLIIYNLKEDIKIGDISIILLFTAFGYIILIATIIRLLTKNSDKVIWKYPKKN